MECLDVGVAKTAYVRSISPEPASKLIRTFVGTQSLQRTSALDLSAFVTQHRVLQRPAAHNKHYKVALEVSLLPIANFPVLRRMVQVEQLGACPEGQCCGT